MKDLLQIDPIELEVGYALIPLVDERQGGDLLERISLLRKQSALELGILIPPIRIRDDIRLPSNEYVIKLRGSEIARAEVMPRFLMALDTGGVRAGDRRHGHDRPVVRHAREVDRRRRAAAEAESCGYVVVEPTTVVATHLIEVLKANAAELLGRQDVQEMVETLKKTHPALVEEVMPGKVSLGVLHRVLQRLLQRARARSATSSRSSRRSATPPSRRRIRSCSCEHARRALSNVIARLYADGDGRRAAASRSGRELEQALTGLFSPRQQHAAAAARDGLLTPDGARRAAARPQPPRDRRRPSTAARCRSSRRRACASACAA